MNDQRTIVLVLRSGGDFAFRDVGLIVRHINGKWKSRIKPRIICLWDKATDKYELDGFEVHPLTNNYPGTWSRMMLYSPEMEQYRPYLYIDLDTAIIQSIENIFDLIKDTTQFIVLQDFWQTGKLATPLVWFPANCDKIKRVWEVWLKNPNYSSFRMDTFLRTVISADNYWQGLTNTIYDFKPKDGKLLMVLPQDANLVCFHGKPRIFKIVEGSLSIDWVKDYVEQTFPEPVKKKVTVIIPYKVNRGWLQDAVNSVPDDTQLIVSQGEGNWPQNFNKVLNQAEGDFIKFLHEDDMLTPNCIKDSLETFDKTGADFIHGDVYELEQHSGKAKLWKSPEPYPTLHSLLKNNKIHSASLMYRKEVFEKLKGFSEDNKMYSFEEFEFNLRCLMNGFKIGYCDKPLAYYRRHPKQIIRTVDNQMRKKYRQELVNSYL